MANKKITELPEIAIVSQNDVLPVVDLAGPETKKIKVSGLKSSLNLTRSDVGLSNVDNTSDVNKPISTATQLALDTKVDQAREGVPNGIATLDGSGKVPAIQLPSYVDDVVEYANLASFPTIGETGKIYIALDTNKTYRWSGSTYIEISPSEVVSVAGKTGAVLLDKNDVGLSNVDNTSDADKPVSTAQAAADAAVQAFSIQRANHTGTQLASTISDFTEAAQDSIVSALTNTSTISFSYNDLDNQITADVNSSSITDSLLSSGINSNKIGSGNVSNTEFNYLSGVTSPIQTQIDGKYSNPIGLASQYIKGDGTFASFPVITAGGGGGAVYYLNGGNSQGTILGNTYYQLSPAANTGAGADFTITGNGLLVSFITDVGSPNLLVVPAGIWIFQAYLSDSSSGGTLPEIYVEVQKYDGTSFTTIATGPAEQITNGTIKDLYTFAVTIPSGTTLSTTDRIVTKLSTQNATGRTITLYTQDANISAVQTTFTTGIAAINGVTSSSQYFGVATAGSDFSISSTGDTHTFNLPSASATSRGALTSADWTVFNNKEPAISPGTTSQYYRGDKTFQTLDKNAVGLGNVDNTSDLNKPISTATQTALNAKYDASNPANYVDASGASAAAPVQSVAGKVGAVTLTKADVGLSNVDNTSDVNKPVSTAQAAADAAVQAFSIQRANHTGTQPASTISDFESTVLSIVTYNVDGGTPTTIYTPSQVINGGTP